MSSFGDLPSGASLKPKPFKAHASDQELADFKQLLKLSKIGPKTYENTIADAKDFTSFGITRDWLAETKQYWETKYDWRETEDKINGYPNFTVPIKDDSTGFTFDIHFIALFSKKADAVPLLLLHGWPGSPLEFLGALSVLMEKYTPDTLPYHVIVPSLPGYAYSSGPPLDQNFDTEGIARVVDKLMIGLGFEKGYITQGGDIGSFVSRVLAVTAKSCLAAHINLFIGIQGEPEGLSEAELAGVERYSNFGNVGNAYARMHGTRPGTIGLVLSSSPVALLAWVGEKLQAWTAETPSVEELLDSVTLYWLTESFPRAIFPYRQFFGAKPTFFHNEPDLYIKKPMGYSWHPKELAPVPKAWVAASGNLVWYKEHSQGGHFAAWEVPKVFVEDIESFVKEVWPTVAPKS